jgi:hypothetical protein
MKVTAILAAVSLACVSGWLLAGCAGLKRPVQPPPEQRDFSYSDSAMAAMAVEMVGDLSAAELPDKGGRPKLAFVGVDNFTGLPATVDVVADSIVAGVVRSGRFRVLDRETVTAQIGDSLFSPEPASAEEAAARLGRVVAATFFLEAEIRSVQVIAGSYGHPAVALALVLVDVDEARRVWSAERVLSRPKPTADSLR